MSVNVQKIADLLEELAPVSLAVQGDNVGLLIGRSDQNVNRVLLALDATKEVINEAIDKKCDMIVTHHPLFRSDLKKINDSTVLGKKILYLIENKIALYSAHTNLDKTDGGVNDHLCNMLGFTDVYALKDENGGNGFMRIGKLAKPAALNELAKDYAIRLLMPNINVIGDLDSIISTAAVVGGSGMSEVSKALAEGVDLFITGDIKYHDASTAYEKGLCLMDITHYGGEVHIMKKVAEYLIEKQEKSSLTYEVILSEINAQPFKII